MNKKLWLIRGKRILDQMQIDESTFQELENNTLSQMPPTTKRQFVVNPIQIVEMTLVPYVPSNMLEAKGKASSGGSKYDTIIVFSDVVYDDTDESNNITFTGSDNNEYHIQPINLNNSNVKVNCSCLDFRWRFALWNSKDGSLHGDPPGPYQKKTDRPPVNPKRIPGICKHLMKSVITLKQSKIVK